MVRPKFLILLSVLIVASLFTIEARAQLDCGCKPGYQCSMGLGGMKCIPRPGPQQPLAPNYPKAPITYDGGTVSAASQNWGDFARCPAQALRGMSERIAAVTSVCASGGNKDCASKIVNVGCRYLKDTAGVIFSANAAPVEVVQSNWGHRITCPENKAVIAICGSGSNPDCGGKPAKITCVGLSGLSKGFISGGWSPDGRVKLGNAGAVWVAQSNWGGTATCPNNMVATGFCGSGGNKDCNGKVSELRCSPIK
jgi:hypothetical protein